MPNMLDRTGTIPGLTGVRFFAALMVFFSHYPIVGSNVFFRSVQDAGYAGVTFFFILSGFIISYNYLDKFETRGKASTLSFYTARFARIYPLYAFCLLLAWLTVSETLPIWPHFLALQAWSGDVQMAMAYNGPGWSISVEAFLYLTFPLIIPALKRFGITESRTKLLSFIALILITQVSLASYFWFSGKGDLSVFDPRSAHRWLYRMPATRLLDFCLGISAAIYYKRFMQQSPTSTLIWRRVTYSSIVAVVLLMSWSANLRSAFSWDAIYAIPFTLFIIGLAQDQSSSLAKFLSTKTLVLLGEASFALYLVHTLVRSLYIYSFEESFLYNMACELLFLTFVIALSIGLHLFIEKPAQKIIRSFLDRINPRQKIRASTLRGAKYNSEP